MSDKILFATEIHGNYGLLRQLMAAVETEAVDVLILGGNLFPDEGTSNDETIELQREFLDSAFKPLFEDLLSRTRITILIHPGNRDLRHPTMALVRKWCRSHPGRAFLVDDGTIDKILSVPVLAYPFVPPTPCGVKDWEKWDDSSGVGIPDSFMKGFQSLEKKGMTPVLLSPQHARDTIQGDLEARRMGMGGGSYVFLAHGPPSFSEADANDPDLPRGSASVRSFIEETRPIVSLHGHVNGAESMSRLFCQRIGETWVLNPGQIAEGEDGPCHYVVFNLENPADTIRHSVYGKPGESESA